jgi:polysaccharide biosynthesis/export protein ExoF
MATIEIGSRAMAPLVNPKPLSRSLSEAAFRSGIKPLLLVLGVSGLAILGAGVVKNWEPVEAASAAVVQKVFAAIGARQDEPAHATAESSRAVVPGPDVVDPLAATPVERSAVPAAPTTAERPKTVGTVPDAPTAAVIAVGDKLKLSFFEPLTADKFSAGRNGQLGPSFSLRAEFSGEYVVASDWSVTVPVIGRVIVVHRTADVVAHDLTEAFDKLIGHAGFVTATITSRSPIYVVGPVKASGAFPFSPGLTILHAIAMAGGLDQGTSEMWQKIEAVRDIQKRSGAVDAMLKLLARAAVLTAERDGTEPKISPRLLELVGATEAANLINEQSERRKAVAMARKNRERTIVTGLEEAKRDVAVYGHMESLDQLIKLRQERVVSMRALVDRNVLSMTVLNQVQSELTDAEQRRRDALNQFAIAKQRLASMEAEALKVQADLKNDLEVEIETIERQVADNEHEFNSSESVLRTLPATRAQFAKEANRLTYEVVRQTADGPVSIESTGMTVLQPGDLVNIIAGEIESSEQVGSPVVTPQSGKRLPAGRSAKQQEAGSAVADQRIGPK